MHSFENVTSMERKRANWVVLEKLFKVSLAPEGLEVLLQRGGTWSTLRRRAAALLLMLLC